MEIGMIGLGRMGGNMAARLMQRGHRVIAYDRSDALVKAQEAAGATGAHALADLVAAFAERPRVTWVMVPAGDATTQTIKELADLGEPGDIIVDGGNTNWEDALRDAAYVAERGQVYLDAGTSGGVWGLENGYCLMVGGDKGGYDHCLPLFQALAPDGGGLVHTGVAGSGHFVKMVHNGIEYALMQAYAEGFEIMKRAATFPGLDLAAIADAWRTGSVVRSWLLDLIALGLKDDPGLDKITGFVDDTGEGRWTVDNAIQWAVPTPVIALSLFERFRSREENTFSNRMLAMMRHQFGGHAVQTRP